MDTQSVTIETNAALSFVQSALPILEAAVPAVGAAAGPIGLGVSAAVVLLPMVLRVVSQLTQKGLISPAQQADLLNRVSGVLDFSGPQWVPSTAKPAVA